MKSNLVGPAYIYRRTTSGNLAQVGQYAPPEQIPHQTKMPFAPQPQLIIATNAAAPNNRDTFVMEEGTPASQMIYRYGEFNAGVYPMQQSPFVNE